MGNTTGVPTSHTPVRVGDRTDHAETVIRVWHDEPGLTILVVRADSSEGCDVCGHTVRLQNGACARCHPPPRPPNPKQPEGDLMENRW